MAIIPAAGLFLITGRSRNQVDDALNSDIAKAFALNIPLRCGRPMVHGIRSDTTSPVHKTSCRKPSTSKRRCRTQLRFPSR